MKTSKKLPVLPESEEAKYKQKCKDLRKRIHEIEESNESVALSIERTKRSIKRLRIERALLLEKVEERTILKVDDSDGTPSPPASPIPNEALKRREQSPSNSGANGPGQHTGADSPPAKTKKPPARDPDLPKRPQNRYRIFCEDEKDNIKKKMEEKFPGESFDLNRAMADAWKELTSEQRKKYNEMYDDARARYIREMAEYQNRNPESDHREIKAAQKMFKELQEKGYPMESPFNTMAASSPQHVPEDDDHDQDMDDHEHEDGEGNHDDLANNQEENEKLGNGPESLKEEQTDNGDDEAV